MGVQKECPRSNTIPKRNWEDQKFQELSTCENKTPGYVLVHFLEIVQRSSFSSRCIPCYLGMAEALCNFYSCNFVISSDNFAVVMSAYSDYLLTFSLLAALRARLNERYLFMFICMLFLTLIRCLP